MPFKRQKSNVSPHYHDTRTLLRKYRDVMWNLEVSDLDLQEEFKAEYGLSTDALFVDSEVNKGGNRLESYARALERSKKMMQIIDTAIDLMRRKHKKGEFYYWILYYAYLSPQQCENAGAILQLLETKGISISLRTYYVHRDEAIEVLSSILWGYTSQDCEKITNLLTPDSPSQKGLPHLLAEALFCIVLYPLKSAKALAIKSIGGEDIDGSFFCKSGVCPQFCFSKYSCTICSIKARSVCGKDFVSAFS